MHIFARLLLFAGLFCLSFTGLQAVHVKGYTRKDGTYVAPHERSSPNSTKNDNWSTKGNVNPYTGKAGTKPGDTNSSTPGASSSEAAGPGTAATPSETAPRKPGTFADLKSSMSDINLKQLLGAPKSVEAKSGFEIWTYPAGHVFVKDGKVVAWKEGK